MSKYFALITDNTVISVIFADDTFLPNVENEHDIIIDVTNRPKPSPGDTYYKENDTFISNKINYTVIPVDSTADYLQTGTDTTFEPFKLSKDSNEFLVKMDGTDIWIGCRKYNALGLRDSFYKVLYQDYKVTSYFAVFEKGPGHGKFALTWDDANLIYQALARIKF